MDRDLVVLKAGHAQDGADVLLPGEDRDGPTDLGNGGHKYHGTHLPLTVLDLALLEKRVVTCQKVLTDAW